LRPLRGKLSARIPTVMTLREILDGIIIAYTSFCLEGDKKAPGDNWLIAGWHLSDPAKSGWRPSPVPARASVSISFPSRRRLWRPRFSRSETGCWSPPEH
jgi:hypothetical protein